MRILRASRLMRILQLLRVFHFFRELRCMVGSTASALASLLKSFMLLAVVALVRRVFIMQVSAPCIMGAHSDPAMGEVLVVLYSSIWNVWFSPFLASSDGSEWEQ